MKRQISETYCWRYSPINLLQNIVEKSLIPILVCIKHFCQAIDSRQVHVWRSVSRNTIRAFHLPKKQRKTRQTSCFPFKLIQNLMLLITPGCLNFFGRKYFALEWKSIGLIFAPTLSLWTLFKFLQDPINDWICFHCSDGRFQSSINYLLYRLLNYKLIPFGWSRFSPKHEFRSFDIIFKNSYATNITS